jgi:hypothetical protein
MCLFITGVLAKTADTPSFRAIVEAHNLAFDTIHNPHIDSQLEPTERYVRVTRGHCDCSTMLGSLHAWQPKERDIAKLRRKGWSDTKIQRWLQSKEHGVRAPATPQGELTSDEWMAFLQDALDEGSVPYLGLMMHWYRRSPEDEQIHVARRERVLADQLDAIDPWVEDVIYEFHGRPHPTEGNAGR